MERAMSNRQVIKPKDTIGVFINTLSDKIFFAKVQESDGCQNRIIPDSINFDENGLIHVEVDRRNLKFANPKS